ncbi:TSUP family transporter [Gordonia desulfuricans]|uniref:Probable membrane transporter protein n=1 Tax=Gordonia desulfuricans TaxID=89051 RepID=A0A7K3LU10_9ACTN|nr:TSUP family transporter [Gordonia desulfuricans]
MLTAAFGAGLLISVVTTPVGVSGAVFLLPVQVSVLGVPSPSVTPTNLMFNLVSIPGALARYRRSGSLRSPLTRLLIAGTVPGVVVGAIVRVVVLPDPRPFKLIVGALLLPLGAWLLLQTRASRPRRQTTDGPDRRVVVALALAAGLVGGVYGIGGGSLLSPILVGRGMVTAVVAPAALTSTFITSGVGAVTFIVLAVATGDSTIAPIWLLGLALGLGGLIGGYLGAHYRSLMPERALKGVLGILAVATAALYLVEVLA